MSMLSDIRSELSSNNRWAWNISLFLVALLVFFWQIPGTIALRNVSLLLLLVSLLGQQFNLYETQGSFIWRALFSPPTLSLLVLSGWMLWVIGVNSPVADVAIVEFRGQWLIPLGCWVSGMLMGLTAFAYSDVWCRRVVTLVFLGLLFQVFLHDLLDIWFWLETGMVPFRQAPVFYLPEIAKSVMSSGHIASAFSGVLPDKFSYVNNTCAALLIAEIVQRVLTKKRFMALSKAWIFFAMPAILLCSFLLRMRNGNIGLLSLVAMTGLFVFIRISERWSKLKFISIILIFVTALAASGWVAYKSDPRWLAFDESVALAFDTDKNRAWLDVSVPYPLMKNGQPVDPSAFERLAWGKEGVKLIQEHPLGLGYNRNAFGVGIEKAYHQKPRSLHAHSGLIDFTIANGVPGLLLWLSFLGALALTGWMAFSTGNLAVGLMLMFLVSSFFGRSIVDSNLRDHILQQFLFLAGLFYTGCRAKLR